MNYKIFAPPPHLKDLVQCYWTLESSQGEATPKEYFLMADSCPEIIFQYDEGFSSYPSQSARMRFQHSVYDRFEVGRKLGFFGVRLYPHAVNQLLGMPANEVTDRVFDLQTLFKSEGEELADKVYNSAGMHERTDHVSNFITKAASVYKLDPIKYFVDQVISSAGSVDVSAMQRGSGLSVKQFERRFKAIAGYPPKYFARIARFQSVKDKYCSNRLNTLTSLAYSCNYYDQAHFNREFKEFAGVNPLQYFRPANNENTKLHKNGHTRGVTDEQQFDGYLRCGWFA